MAWSSGSFSRVRGSASWTTDYNNNTGIEPGLHDTNDQDLAIGINNCLAKDGQNSATGNLDLGGNRLTNVGNAVNAQDAVTLSQAQAGIDTQSTTLATTATRFSNDTTGPSIALRKSKGAIVGTNTLVASGDGLGTILFQGANGTGYTSAAAINSNVDGTPGATNDMPGRLGFFTTADGSGTLIERMRIDSQGRVGIATTTPGNSLDIGNGTSPIGVGIRLNGGSGNDSGGGIFFANGGTTNSAIGAWSSIIGGSQNNALLLWAGSGNEIRFVTNGGGNERMRIVSGGNILFHCTTSGNNAGEAYFAPSSATQPPTLRFAKTFSGTRNVIINYTSGNYVGGVDMSDTATAFVTSSDYRIKENIVPMPNALNRVNQLNPIRFNFKTDPNNEIDGFLAHEVAEVVPNAVFGEKDGVNEDGTMFVQSLDHSKLIPLLAGAIQELSAKVEALEAQLAE